MLHTFHAPQVAIIRARLENKGFVHKDNYVDVDDDRGDMDEAGLRDAIENKKRKEESRVADLNIGINGVEKDDEGYGCGGATTRVCVCVCVGLLGD